MSRLSGALLCILLPVTAAVARQSVNFPTLGGHIEDPSGAAVSGATVQILHIDRNQSSESTTDAQGRFRFPYLSVGEYEIRIQQSGFQPIVRKVNLSIGQAVDIPIELSVAAVTATFNHVSYVEFDLRKFRAQVHIPFGTMEKMAKCIVSGIFSTKRQVETALDEIPQAESSRSSKE